MLRDQESVPNLNISVLENPIVSSSGSRTVFDRGRSPRWLGNGEIILLTVSSHLEHTLCCCIVRVFFRSFPASRLSLIIKKRRRRKRNGNGKKFLPADFFSIKFGWSHDYRKRRTSRAVSRFVEYSTKEGLRA